MSEIAYGFEVALQPQALLFCLIGVTIGTAVGVLPGIGAIAAISMALPLTYGLDTTVALIMLAGIFYGAQYGSSTAAILLNLPGTPTSAVTCLDGYPMAQQGKAGVALFVTTISSFIGGSFAIVLLMAVAPALARAALQFSATEYVAIMLLGLVAASSMSSGSAFKGLAMVTLGLTIGLVGIDINTGIVRFNLGLPELIDGVSLVAVGMGLFGVSEVLNSLRNPTERRKVEHVSLRSMLPSGTEFRKSLAPTARGSVIGAFFGVLPGSGPTIASFFSYSIERNVSKQPKRFGKGAIEGISAPEAANNSAVQAAFIPTLSLGIPGDAVMAVLLGALILHGIVPGPQVVTERPDLFWGLVASFWIGNVILLILNIPMIGLWVKILSIPYRFLYPPILFFIAIGVYSMRSSVFDIYVTIIFGLIGYAMLVYRYPIAPLILGFLLGPMLEENFKRAMLQSRGDLMVFVERPISLVILLITIGVISWALVGGLRRRQKALDQKS